MLALERSGAAETQPQAWPCLSIIRRRSCPAECKISGGHGGGETPVPIPNTAVKPARADGTWGEAPWESRSPPGFLIDSIPSELRLGGILSFQESFDLTCFRVGRREPTAKLRLMRTETETLHN